MGLDSPSVLNGEVTCNAVMPIRYFAVLRTAFKAWLGFHVGRQSKREQQQRLVTVHGFWQRKQAWAVWRRDFMPVARARSQAQSIAKQHWHSTSLRSTLRAWAEVGCASRWLNLDLKPTASFCLAGWELVFTFHVKTVLHITERHVMLFVFSCTLCDSWQSALEWHWSLPSQLHKHQ